MEELKLLVGMVADLPDMALWVIGFFFAYKVFIVGSIYGTVKFIAQKFVEWRTFVKPEVKPFPKEYDFKGLIADEATLMLLVTQIARVKRSRYNSLDASDVKEFEKIVDKFLTPEK